MPRVGMCIVCVRNSKEASVARADPGRESEMGKADDERMVWGYHGYCLEELWISI